MLIRRKKNSKFVLPPSSIPEGVPEDSEFYIVLRTLSRVERDEAVSQALVTRYKQPMTEEGLQKMQDDGYAEVEQTYKAGIVSRAEIEASLVKFVLPEENDDGTIGVVSSEGMNPIKRIDFLMMGDEEFLFFLDVCIDCVKGEKPSKAQWKRLEEMGVTPEILLLDPSDYVRGEGVEKLGNPTESGDSASS